jgi:hypothetical protein
MNHNHYEQKKQAARYSSLEPTNDPNLAYWQNQNIKDEWRNSRKVDKPAGPFTKFDAFMSGLWMAVGWLMGFTMLFGVFKFSADLETGIAAVIYIPTLAALFYLFRKPIKRYWANETGYIHFKD